MAELKQCPFCEGYAFVTTLQTNFFQPYGAVICHDCGAMMKGKNEADAVRKWNRRASDESDE